MVKNTNSELVNLTLLSNFNINVYTGGKDQL